MDELHVFLSVGGTATDKQEAFVRAVEERLRGEGLFPHTVGRDTFSPDAPLKTITELMDKCAGTVIIALERVYFPAGVDKRGGDKEKSLTEVKLPTPWNQIEAAMAYARQHPLMVIVEAGLRSEGLLERGYDWYVQWVTPEASSLNTLEFNGILASWKSKIAQSASAKKDAKIQTVNINIVDLTIGEIVKRLKPTQLWSILVALAGLVVGAFVMGAKFNGGH
jgi:hypothetical protein